MIIKTSTILFWPPGRRLHQKYFGLEKEYLFFANPFSHYIFLLFKPNTTLWSFLKYYPTNKTWLVAAKERQLGTHSVLRMSLFKSMTTNKWVEVRIVTTNLVKNISFLKKTFQIGII